MSDPAWAAFTDEQLLEVRMCDLGLTIEGTDLEARIAQLNTELDARGTPTRTPRTSPVRAAVYWDTGAAALVASAGSAPASTSRVRAAS